MTLHPETEAAVRFYWRPGCPFCSSLRRGLRRRALPMEEVDIWDDPEAAAFVRSVADGNETVPTVTVGTRSLINPSVSQVVAAVAAEAPHLLAESDDIARRPGLVARLLGRGASRGRRAREDHLTPRAR